MIIKFLKGMKYAVKGIYTGIKEERNIRIDIVAALYVHAFSLFYDFTLSQRVMIVLICFNVMAFELMNTAVERAVDKPDDAHYMSAGDAKDTAAGGVLLAAIGAAVAGVMLFWNVETFKKIFAFFKDDISHCIIFAVSMVFSYLFIVYDKFKKR